jgi:hypothetical protein
LSLILDALKKLERDKEASAPGVLVVGAVPWEGVRRRRASVLGLVLALVALLVLLGISLGAWMLGRAPRASPAEARAPGRPPSAATTPSAPPARRLALPEPAPGSARATAEPAPAAVSPRSGPQLNAISRQDGRPVAVIDGRLMREGDSVDGVRVLRIGETEVEVEVRGRQRTLRF